MLLGIKAYSIFILPHTYNVSLLTIQTIGYTEAKKNAKLQSKDDRTKSKTNRDVCASFNFVLVLFAQFDAFAKTRL